MNLEFNDILPDDYVPISAAAKYVNRSERTIYDWINFDGVRAVHEPRQPVLVNMKDVIAVDAKRARGRRRKPTPPTHL